MMVQQDFTKSSGFHEIQQDVTATNRKSNHMLLKSTEFHSISLKPKGLHVKSRRLHKN